MLNKCFLAFFFLMVVLAAKAQNDTLKILELQSINVSAPRLNGELLSLPLSITSIQSSKINYSKSQFSINEYLGEVPGLFALNQNNFAQDLRISIRGFGARSAFGIRGVKLFVDGIPETTPDGQSQVDNLDIGLINKIEIIRGPSAGIFGNASGGVISIQTNKEFTGNFSEIGISYGSFKRQQYQAKSGIKFENSSLLFNVNHNRSNGFRQNSKMQSTIFSGNWNKKISEYAKLDLIVNFVDSPTAQDPGGLKIEEVEIDRSQARDRNLIFKAEESVRQLKVAAKFQKEIKEEWVFNSKVYYIKRDFQGKLPFEFGGIVNLKRNFLGHDTGFSKDYPFLKGMARTSIGYDVQYQRDHRLRYINSEGQKAGLTFDQIEAFANFGTYISQNISWNNKVKINANLRNDVNWLKADDKFTSNGDDSGRIDLSNLNGGVGGSYFFSQKFIPFTRFSTSFETPTLSEYSSNPLGEGGFNHLLEPQKAKNIELGFKGRSSGVLRYEFALFNIRTRNEIISFEITDFPERDFYRNAGKTNRNGGELNVQWAMKKTLISGSYTYSEFKFLDYDTGAEIYDGERLPGIPKHSGSLSVRYIDEQIFFKILSRMVGPLYTNDSNTVKDGPYVLLNINVGFQKKWRAWSLYPFCGLNNLLDTKYNDNIRINAFGGRFFEPAPGINIYGGIRVRI